MAKANEIVRASWAKSWGKKGHVEGNTVMGATLDPRGRRRSFGGCRLGPTTGVELDNELEGKSGEQDEFKDLVRVEAPASSAKLDIMGLI